MRLGTKKAVFGISSPVPMFLNIVKPSEYETQVPDLRGMFTTSITFRPPSRTFLRRNVLGIRVQHGLSFNDPFKQHNSRSRICCLRQLSRLRRMFDLFNTIADDTFSKKRFSIRLAEEPISPLLPSSHWNW